MANKRTLDHFFQSSSKKARGPDSAPAVTQDTSERVAFAPGNEDQDASPPRSTHATYPFPIPFLPSSITTLLLVPDRSSSESEATASNEKSIGKTRRIPASDGRVINDQLDLDLLYFEPYFPKGIESQMFEFLRRELFFYRVEYKIQRGSVATQIRTPRL